nr:uncharacterized protein LOC111960133 [Salvelinus alpinus]
MSSLNVDSSLLPEEQFLCSICLNVFTDPVTTPCGHTFCKVCISGYWDNSEICQCLKCQKRFYVRPEVSTNSVIEEISVHIKRRRLDIPECSVSVGEVACDVCSTIKLKALKSCLVCLTSYCETHLEPHQRVVNLKRHKLIDPVNNLEDRMCKKHERGLELFCRTDQTCVCVLCTETDHKCHNTVPIEEEGVKQKAELVSTKAEVQKMIQDRHAKMEEIKHSVVLSKKSTEKEVEDSEKLFTELLQSIKKRRTKLVKVIEERQKAAERRAEGLTQQLEQEITELQKRSTELEQALSQIEENIRGELKVLTEIELTRMQEFKDEVTLDPNTANRWLQLSEDGMRTKYAKTAQTVSDNPKRFDYYSAVLGEKGFNSGRHYWEVQVGVSGRWEVGIAMRAVNRKKAVKKNSEHGFFVLSKSGYLEYEAGSSPPTTFNLNPIPRRVGVYVDYEKGQVSFYDVLAKSHLYSFLEMSSLNADSSLLPEEQFLCSICLNVFTDPVTTPCGHTFCKVCISGHWDNNSPGASSESVNLKRHKLIDPVENLEDRIDMGAHQKGELAAAKAEVGKMVQKSTNKDIEDSENLFTNLLRSVDERRTNLKQVMEAMQTAAEKRAEGLINDLEQEITELQRRSTELEQLSHTEDHLHFLQATSLQTYLTLCAPPSTKDFSEISVYSDLCVGIVRRAVSNLVEIFKRELKTLTDMELKRMGGFKEDVTLDSNTASRWICLFDGGKRIKYTKTPQIISDNPERFDIYPMVLGEKGFNSERHYWEVQVGLRNDWDVGVAKETVNRKEKVQIISAHGFFALGKDGFDYKVHSSPLKNLYLNPRPRKIGIYVDYERGQVSFYDVDEKSHIYSFTNQSFTEKLYPYFYVYSKAKKSEALVISCMEDPRARYLSLLQAVSKAKE